MPPVIKPKTRPKKKKEDALTGSERITLAIGLVIAFFFAVGFAAFMFAVLRENPLTPTTHASSVPIPPDYPRHLVDFSLTDESGRAVKRQDLQGKIVLVNFVFTTCAAVCPYVNAQMEKIQNLTAHQSDVRLLSLALDPVDDTAPVLAQYGRTYGQDKSRWSFLTGDKLEMRRFVGTSFLPPDTTGDFSYMPGAFANTERIALVDPKGRIVEYFDGLNQETADTAIKEIAKLRNSQL